MRHLLSLLCLTFMAPTFGTTNLAWVCTDTTQAGQTVEDCSPQRWDYADRGLIAVGTRWENSIWRPLSAAAGTALACTRDISPGATQCGLNYAGEAYIAVAQLAISSPTPPPVTTGKSTLTWVHDGLDTTGYRLLYGMGALTQRVEVNNPALRTYTITGLTPGVWSFGVQALNGSAESAIKNATNTVTIEDQLPPPPIKKYVVRPIAAGSRPATELVRNVGDTTWVLGHKLGDVAVGQPCKDELRFKSGSNEYREVTTAALLSPTYRGRTVVAVCVVQ